MPRFSFSVRSLSVLFSSVCFICYLYTKHRLISPFCCFFHILCTCIHLRLNYFTYFITSFLYSASVSPFFSFCTPSCPLLRFLVIPFTFSFVVSLLSLISLLLSNFFCFSFQISSFISAHI